MTKIALCIYTDNADYKIDPALEAFGYEIFFEYHKNLFFALRNVSVKKRIHELKLLEEYDICIGYDPMRSNIDDLNLKDPEYNKVYYAYGHFNSTKFLTGAEPSLFFSKTVEFNRVCEFSDNYENIKDLRLEKISEKFIFHIRSLYLRNECVNYENSNLFIRTT